MIQKYFNQKHSKNPLGFSLVCESQEMCLLGLFTKHFYLPVFLRFLYSVRYTYTFCIGPFVPKNTDLLLGSGHSTDAHF